MPAGDWTEYSIANTAFKHWNGIVSRIIQDIIKYALSRYSVRSHRKLYVAPRKTNNFRRSFFSYYGQKYDQIKILVCKILKQRIFEACFKEKLFTSSLNISKFKLLSYYYDR